jgi:transcription initiation factor TFIIIB Brf1 subunit/transcription initiation factor TFIIB
VPKDAKGRALAEAKRAQLDYERKVKAAREARRKTFAQAQKAGSSLAEIGEAVGLHRSRVGEILRGAGHLEARSAAARSGTDDRADLP